VDVSLAPALPRRPVLLFWLIAVAIEFVVAAVFMVTGAESAIQEGLDAAGLEFRTDLIGALLVVVAYPAAAFGVLLALCQVAAPDLAVIGVSAVKGGRDVLTTVRARLRPWSRSVGRWAGLRIWALVVVLFTLCNLASGVLHWATIGDHLTWGWNWSILFMLPVAMFFDAGALFEENGWRGYALPVLLRDHGPLAASLLVGLAWASWHYPVKFTVFLDYGWVTGLLVLGAFTVKLVALSVVMTFFWARAGQATLLAIAMHGLSNDAARVGGLTDPTTWQVEVVSELNLALLLAVLAVGCVLVARRNGWGDVRGWDRWRH